jgi:hypothetical protein
VLDHHPLDAQIVAPHLFDQFGVMAALDVDPAGQRGPRPGLPHGHRTRRGARRHGGAARRGQDHRLAVEQEARSERERPRPTAPVLQIDGAGFDADDGADVAGLRVLDHHAQLDRLFGGAGAGGRVRVAGQDVAAVAIGHRVILELRSPASRHRNA